jgi:hypothetical protein
MKLLLKVFLGIGDSGIGDYWKIEIAIPETFGTLFLF